MALFLMCVLLLGAAAAVSSCKTVAAGRVMVLERRGRFYRELYSGIHWINPFLDKIRPVQWPGQSAKPTLPLDESVRKLTVSITTKDGYDLYAETNLFFALEDASLAAYTQTPLAELLDAHTQDVLARLARRENWETLFTVSPSAQKALSQRLNTLINQYTAPEDVKANYGKISQTINQFPTGKDDLQAALQNELARRAQNWGITVGRTEIAQLLPGAELRAEMDRRIRADYAARHPAKTDL